MNVVISPAFKSMATKAIIAIVLFIIVYLLLFWGAIAITLLCFYIAISIFSIGFSSVTFILAIGIASLGVIILIFLLKFLFKKSKTDLSHLTEVTRDQEPRLFECIDEIARQVDTKPPKKVYLSSAVNASVFYDSSFWSMFLPIRKNLEIGIGLVNATTEQELKAILAHEFGHFSQKSMKVGSYVYNVNKVIFNMLFDNESFQSIIQSWSGITAFFSFIALIGVKIINGIQWILMKMYKVVNVQYMALSREMEFHADEIAAHVAGSKSLETALLRLELASSALSTSINFYNEKIGECLISSNIFSDQKIAMNFIGEQNKLNFVNGYPDIQLSDISKFNKSKLVITNQWASHPSLEDRIKALKKIAIPVHNESNRAAGQLFSSYQNIQESITTKIFEQVRYPKDTITLSSDDFKTSFVNQHKSLSLPVEYEGYYDKKDPVYFDVASLTLNTNVPEKMEELFRSETQEDINNFYVLEADIALIKQIQTEETDIKTFDYDGVKYYKKEIVSLLLTLEKELSAIQSKIQEHDRNIYLFFYKKSIEKNTETTLVDLYRLLNDELIRKTEHVDFVKEIHKDMEYIRVPRTASDFYVHFDGISYKESKIKVSLRELLNDPLIQSDITVAVRERCEYYCNTKLTYFLEDRFYPEELDRFATALHDLVSLTELRLFRRKKELLIFQLSLL